jgi:hypothetical protein
MPDEAVVQLRDSTFGFRVTGYLLELTGYCRECDAGAARAV